MFCVEAILKFYLFWALYHCALFCVQSTMLFLPCGHVCTCVPCSKTVTICPLDRVPITQNVHLLLPASDEPGDDDAF